MAKFTEEKLELVIIELLETSRNIWE